MFTKSTFYFGISSEVLSWEGDQPWDFFGRNVAKAETPVLWPPHAKSWLIGKDCDAGRDWGQEEKGTTEDEMAGWHHGLDGHESEWTQGVGDGQGGLAIHGVTKSQTRLSDWTELNWIIHNILALGVFPIIWICPLRLLNCFTATIFFFPPAAWGIYPDKGSNLCHLHWKVES